MNEIKRTMIYLPIEDHTKLKVLAAKLKTSIAEIIRQLVSKELSK